MLALQDEDGALFEGVPDADSSAAAAPEDVDRAAHAAAAHAAATSAGIGKFLNHIGPGQTHALYTCCSAIVLEII